MTKVVATAIVLLWTLSLPGCHEVTKVLPKRTWHEKFNWKAEDYFDDAKVIALCKAIDGNDLDFGIGV